MKRTLITLAIVLICCCSVAFGLSQDGKPAQKRKVVGISTVRLSQRVVRVYRIFDDGSLEILDDGGNPNVTWHKVGR